ncbi:MAG: T4 RnlA family RNA ligase [Candidatus Obscuribacterales bacterium]|nr:T4 RnlA family RNA ligase [Candidatus Obscuribacterales bacterium]
MPITENVANLKRFVSLLVRSRVRNSADWRRWRQKEENEKRMEELFGYTRLEEMPSITNLVKPFFHPELPLIGLNYTQVAHNVLHQYPSGWTGPLRLCRGIIFSRRGKLVALPFPKFFNDGEMEETRNLPDEPFVATEKHDGHLGIIFEFQGKIVATTRGSFESKSAILANGMLETIGSGWETSFPRNTTVLVEVIHPDTEVIVDYHGEEAFILIGAFNRVTLEDYAEPALKKLAKRLAIPRAETWEGNSIEELRALVAETNYKNKEGFVVRFASGFRVKLKHAGYVSKMIAGKLTPLYVMQRLMTDTFEDRFADLDAEIQIQADRIKEKVMAVSAVPGDKKAKWKYLYELFDEEERTAYRKKICRDFYNWLTEQGEGEVAA